MLVLLSPAKTLDMSPSEGETTLPRLLDDSAELIAGLRNQSPADIQKLMKVSENLANLNYERFQAYQTPFTSENASAAGSVFRGDVYQDLQYTSFDPRQKAFADRQLRILSGLYGLLRPSDLMQAYRLEMGTRFANARGKNLYEFWGDKITALLNADLAEQDEKTVLNLASQEYFKSVKTEQLNGRLLTAHFKELRGGKYKVVAFNAKKARGKLANLITLEGISEPEPMKDFVVNDYVYNPALSTEDDWVWTK